jgi:hypothetical protein
MITFKQYIIESASKNTHLEHLEDEIFNGGINGTRKALDFLRGLRDMLKGSSKSSVNVTVKWDGAPSIICGINPENKKFFVATKAAFNKDPKLNYTHADIDKNHAGAGTLIDKLKLALDSLSTSGIKGIIQGDILFTRSSLQRKEINGEQLLTFTPNTITYAVPADSQLAHEMSMANIGIVFHTSYSGNKIAKLKATFNANISGLKKTPAAWITDATFRDESGSATLTKDETDYVSVRLSEIGRLFNQMDSTSINKIVSDAELILMVKTYINTKVRVGENITGTKKYAKGLITFIKERYQKEIDKLKTDRGKEGRKLKLKEIVSFINTHQDQFIIMFMIAALMADVKGVFLKKLRKVNSVGTFLETPEGFKVTSPEGFVAVDQMGSAVKLVDRLEFSRANFTQTKNW